MSSGQMELLDTILHELDQQLNSIPKSDLIAQEPNMSRMLQVGILPFILFFVLQDFFLQMIPSNMTKYEKILV